MSTRTVIYIVTATPIPESPLTSTYPPSALSSTTPSNHSPTAIPNPVGGGDNPINPPSAGPGFPWRPAPHSTTSLLSQLSYTSSDLFRTLPPWPLVSTTPPPPPPVVTVIVTVTTTPPASTRAASDFIVLMEYLSQVPSGWPYTEFGVGRTKEVVTWGLTDEEGKTVAEVRHQVQWWPRPLWTGVLRSEGEDGLLEGWRPTFVVPKAVMASTAAADVRPKATGTASETKS